MRPYWQLTQLRLITALAWCCFKLVTLLNRAHFALARRGADLEQLLNMTHPDDLN